MQKKQNIKDLSLLEISENLLDLGEPKFRSKQVIQWLYEKEVSIFREMRNLPTSLIEKLEENFSLDELSIKYCLESSKGDAVKFGLLTNDNKIIESVILIDGKRRTLCVSSQVGCALGCVFCETGKLGFIRNLSQAEILNQIIIADRYLLKNGDKKITNLVFMGMGEALFNFNNFTSAIKIIMDEKGFGIGGRKITVSTAGVIPSIEKLQNSDLNIGLAISLNSYKDSIRDNVMPINKKYPISQLIKAADTFSKIKRSRVTFEYVVIENQNDNKEAASTLIKLLKGVNCKLNLIPLNPYRKNNLHAPTEERLDNFGKILSDGGLTVTVRRSRGQDISGACGQLAGSIVNT